MTPRRRTSLSWEAAGELQVCWTRWTPMTTTLYVPFFYSCVQFALHTHTVCHQPKKLLPFHPSTPKCRHRHSEPTLDHPTYVVCSSRTTPEPRDAIYPYHFTTSGPSTGSSTRHVFAYALFTYWRRRDEAYGCQGRVLASRVEGACAESITYAEMCI